ncbi:hypothetical protein GOB94_14085 [Granulicella sp. 5B5]|uniref:hypothetical protein n=1 Tax=Granulicella sp. 5B5 TaxID=1617967 RepID=UPI0015F5992B|nr:hypothetical protein [Granulicella sp. 5B5]QMV19695.1 hypothetical protein GOB94_14085 [Granulicella sp. 5B5]
MKSQAILSVMALLLVISAKAQVMVKGHYIGETAADFLRSEPSIVDDLASCHLDDPEPPRKLTQDDVREAFRQRRAVIMNGEEVTKAEAERLAAEGKLLQEFPDDRTPTEKSRCSILYAAFESSAHLSGFFSRSKNIARVEWQFSNGKLAEILVQYSLEDADRVSDDFSKRVGFPPKNSETAEFNVYGARWADNSSCWDGSFTFACLSESHNPADSYATLHLISKELLQQESAERAKRPSPLD